MYQYQLIEKKEETRILFNSINQLRMGGQVQKKQAQKKKATSQVDRLPHQPFHPEKEAELPVASPRTVTIIIATPEAEI
jgi:hypothetical protein